MSTNLTGELNDIAMPDAPFDIVGCDMAHVCTKRLGALTPTLNPVERQCADCMKVVTFCTDQRSLEIAAASGGCVAYLRQEGNMNRITLGLPASRSLKLMRYLDDL